MLKCFENAADGGSNGTIHANFLQEVHASLASVDLQHSVNLTHIVAV